MSGYGETRPRNKKWSQRALNRRIDIRIAPLITPEPIATVTSGTVSHTFVNALELLVAGGYSLSHAMMMMIPEAWNNNKLMDPERRAFYEYNAALMEPWDGPAAIAFTDGRQVGATLDRHGLRPARYMVTSDDLVIMGSEDGVLPVSDDNVVQKWRLQPGKMLLIDLEEGRIIGDE